MTSQRRPRILITNDDGPPAPQSPYVLGLYRALLAAGWRKDEVAVCLPSSQKSWSGMQFSIHAPVGVWWYYPIEGNDNGTHQETQKSWSTESRRVETERGEIGEWVVVDGSPTTAANMGLYNQSAFSARPGSDSGKQNPEQPFDLVISGPNYGRNSGAAFALSSGTLGAAMAASLSGTPAIALSYAHFGKDPPGGSGPNASEEKAKRQPTEVGSKPKDPAMVAPNASVELVQMAHELSVRIIERLWQDWPKEQGVGAYSINIPLAWTLKEPKVFWTRIWQNRYYRLFRPVLSAPNPSPIHAPSGAPAPSTYLHFAPDMPALLAPKGAALEEAAGTDVWAVQQGWVSVCRVRPNFMEVDARGVGLVGHAGPHDEAGEGREIDEDRKVGREWKL